MPATLHIYVKWMGGTSALPKMKWMFCPHKNLTKLFLHAFVNSLQFEMPMNYNLQRRSIVLTLNSTIASIL